MKKQQKYMTALERQLLRALVDLVGTEGFEAGTERVKAVVQARIAIGAAMRKWKGAKF